MASVGQSMSAGRWQWFARSCPARRGTSALREIRKVIALFTRPWHLAGAPGTEGYAAAPTLSAIVTKNAAVTCVEGCDVRGLGHPVNVKQLHHFCSFSSEELHTFTFCISLNKNRKANLDVFFFLVNTGDTFSCECDFNTV